MTTPAKHSTRYRIVSTIIIIASTGLGYIFGALAEHLYMSSNTPYSATGWITGLISGLVVAILYLITIEAKRNCPIFSAHFMLYATLAGTAAGTASATALHITLIIARNEFEPIFLAGGIAFGLVAGSILGIIAAALLKKEYSTKTLPTTPTEEENTEKPTN